MSAAALFIPTTDQGAGSYHVPVSERIADLPREEQRAADLVWKTIVEFLPRGKTQFTIMDKALRRSRWLRAFSLRFVQKGLKALEAIGAIERRRRHGLREIIVLERLRGRARRPAEPAKGKTKAAQVPNVGTIPMATPEQQAAALAAVEAASETPSLEMTADEEAAALAAVEAAKARNRRAAERSAPKAKVDRPATEPRPGILEIQARLEQRQAEAAAEKAKAPAPRPGDPRPLFGP